MRDGKLGSLDFSLDGSFVEFFFWVGRFQSWISWISWFLVLHENLEAGGDYST